MIWLFFFLVSCGDSRPKQELSEGGLTGSSLDLVSRDKEITTRIQTHLLDVETEFYFPSQWEDHVLTSCGCSSSFDQCEVTQFQNSQCYIKRLSLKRENVKAYAIYTKLSDYPLQTKFSSDNQAIELSLPSIDISDYYDVEIKNNAPNQNTISCDDDTILIGCYHSDTSSGIFAQIDGPTQACTVQALSKSKSHKFAAYCLRATPALSPCQTYRLALYGDNSQFCQNEADLKDHTSK
jgi:hypothetical protein